MNNNISANIYVEEGSRKYLVERKAKGKGNV